jgi:hypothetical protein
VLSYVDLLATSDELESGYENVEAAKDVANPLREIPTAASMVGPRSFQTAKIVLT